MAIIIATGLAAIGPDNINENGGIRSLDSYFLLLNLGLYL